MISNTISTAELQFRDFLASHGHPLIGEINYDSSKIHYLKCPHGSSTDARYIFYSDGIPSWFLQCWPCDIKVSFCSKQKHEISSEEWHIHLKRMEEHKKQNEIEIANKHASTAIIAKEIFSKANLDQAASHPYLRLKQVKNYGLRVVTNEHSTFEEYGLYKGTLLVPCHNENEEIINIERIYFDNKENKFQKRPLTGGQRVGAYFFIGKVHNPRGIIYIAEGYATGATICESTLSPTVIAFNCGNLMPVTKIIRKKYPEAQLVIVADDDKWKEKLELRHSGLKAAKQSISNIKNASYLLPDFSILNFSEQELSKDKPTDINDLLVLLLKNGMKRPESLEIIRKQLSCQSILHTEIFSNLIKKIPHIDFRALSEIDENEKLKNSHFQIIAIEKILEIAKINQWGICRNHDFIYLFNGAYWNLCDVEELKTFLGESSEKMGIDKFKARYYNFRDHLFKQFMAVANLPKPEPQKDAVLINLKNGTFEITPEKTQLRGFDRSDFMTYQLPFEYDPNAQAPLFEKYLNAVLPEKQRQNILSEYLGYVFIHTSTLKLEKTLLLYGTGANGKSVFYEIVRSLFGEQNTSEYSLQSLTNDTGYFRAMIANKLINYASEINGKLETSIFKQLVSGEPVEARLPYGHPFTITHYAKLIFNCNELPKDVEQTNAYFRRFLIVPFEITIPEEEQDKQLAQKIITNELSGVFNWVLQGLRRLLEQKCFSECDAVRRACEQYELESDSVRLFIQEMEYKPSPTDHKQIKLLYSEYRGFCQDDGYKPVSKTNFIKRLKSCRILIEKKNIGNVAFLVR
jgi:putative DNA primase/helicase